MNNGNGKYPTKWFSIYADSGDFVQFSKNDNCDVTPVKGVFYNQIMQMFNVSYEGNNEII